MKHSLLLSADIFFKLLNVDNIRNLQQKVTPSTYEVRKGKERYSILLLGHNDDFNKSDMITV